MLRYTESEGAISFAVRVVVRASRTSVAGISEGALRVRVAAPPVDGAANGELMRFLARALGVASTAVEITGGHTSKHKRLRVRGAQAAKLVELAAEGKEIRR